MKTQEFVEVNPLKGSNVQAQVAVPDTLSVLGDGEKLKKGQHLFRILTAKDGDKRVVWNSGNLGEIEDAKKMFDQLIQEGMVPYVVGSDGKSTGIVMDEFSPECEEVIFLPIGNKSKTGLLAGG